MKGAFFVETMVGCSHGCKSLEQPFFLLLGCESSQYKVQSMFRLCTNWLIINRLITKLTCAEDVRCLKWVSVGRTPVCEECLEGLRVINWSSKVVPPSPGCRLVVRKGDYSSRDLAKSVMSKKRWQRPEPEGVAGHVSDVGPSNAIYGTGIAAE